MRLVPRAADLENVDAAFNSGLDDRMKTKLFSLKNKFLLKKNYRIPQLNLQIQKLSARLQLKKK